MKRYAIAGIAAGAAMMIGGRAGRRVEFAVQRRPKSLAAADAGVMNPMIDGQAMLPGRTCWKISPPRRTIPTWWRR
jgi:hypothetical protein